MTSPPSVSQWVSVVMCRLSSSSVNEQKLLAELRKRKTGNKGALPSTCSQSACIDAMNSG